MLNIRTAARVIGVEYLQNLPVLVGLLLAIRAEGLPLKLIALALGAAGTAITIAYTERIKLANDKRERPADMISNALTFFAGGAIYLLYSAVRGNIAIPLLADVVVGAVIGLLAGGSQMFFVDERALTRQAIFHTLALMLTGIVMLALIGALADSWPPILAALALCVLMTAIIVRIDYWQMMVESPVTKS